MQTHVAVAAPARAPLFAADLARHGDGVAVVADGRAVTYAELDDRVGDVAARLGTARRLVLVAAANRLDPLVGYLGALRGGHPVLLAPGDDDERLGALAATYDPDVVVGGDATEGMEERRRRSAHDLHPDLALLLSTSGSTGAAKLVRLSRRNLEANARSIARYLDLTPADRAVTTLPMQYCYGLSVLNSHLLAGAGVVLAERSVVDRCFWDLFRATAATSFAGVPHTFDLLDRVGFEAMSLPSLRYVTQAGGRLDPETVRRYATLGERRGWQFFVMYGQTEATARMAYLPPALAAASPHAIGAPIPGGSFALDDVDRDGVGELVYRGPNVMLGYAESPRDLAEGATVDALRTGDLARVTPDGLYEVVGRRSRFVKLFGLRVDLDQVERVLAAAGVAALCTGTDDGLVVAVEGSPDGPTVHRLVADRVGVPRSAVRVVGVAALPRLANGKPDYAAVARHAAADRGGPPENPGDPVAAVRALYRDVLGTEPSDGDSFVDLGGDSLSYVETSIRLEAIVGTLPSDWHTRPVGELLPEAGPRGLVARTETGVVLRALSILLVVGTHTGLWSLAGGAHLLLGVAGYNFARFQLRAASTTAAVARIAVPSACWIGAVALVTDDFGWRHALLLNGSLGPAGARWAYWYVEAVVVVLVGLGVLTAVPAVRRAERRWPFGVAVAATVAALAVRFDLLGLPALHHRVFRPHEVLWLVTLGWAAARATTGGRRLAVSLLMASAVPGFFGDGPREAIVAVGLLSLTWVPTLPVPRPANRLVGAVAGASLAIYLTHWQVHPLWRAHGAAVATVASVVTGMMVWSLVCRATRRRPGHPTARRTAGAAATKAAATARRATPWRSPNAADSQPTTVGPSTNPR